MNSPQTPAEQLAGSGDVIGFKVTVVIVAVVVILGFISMVRWDNRDAAVKDYIGDFNDDLAIDAELLHADPAEVAALEAERPMMTPRGRT
ncbi:hypothetical protein [Aeromicrobium panaciterrae]|uniref:hypothetical protein n=1 Tax=Aeromicrobium panaciterrae TaxID=363861 RepID=UPI0031D451A0